MLKDTARPNGTIKRIQYVRAFRGGTSSMGTPYKKGTPIIHLSSSRCTGETFVLLPAEVCKDILDIKAEFGYEWWADSHPGKWQSPKEWSKALKVIWNKHFVKIHGHPLGKCAEAKHTNEFYAEAREKWKKLGMRGY